jgi:3-phenylpropionate/trans-cinnamate dioxygenase ferredoxin subunit
MHVSEEFESEYVDVTAASEFAPGSLRAFDVAGHEILICRAGDSYFALENRCSHTHAPLTAARIRGDCIVCPVHGARFQLRDGRHLTPPAWSGLRTFATRVVDGRVLISPTPIDPPGSEGAPR